MASHLVFLPGGPCIAIYGGPQVSPPVWGWVAQVEWGGWEGVMRWQGWEVEGVVGRKPWD